jgi:Calcineurin-like phosphoesterase
VFVHSGDFTDRAEPEEIAQFDADLAQLPFRHLVVIPGNHDWPDSENHAAGVDWSDANWVRRALPRTCERKIGTAQTQSQEALEPLESGCIARGTGGSLWFPSFELVEIRLRADAQPLRLFAFPWMPFHGWSGRLRDPTDEKARAREQWCFEQLETCSRDGPVDVVVSHMPPFSFCDMTSGGTPAGSRRLLDGIAKVEPRAHLFGHVHESAGWVRHGSTTFVNSAACSRGGTVDQQPHVLSLELLLTG